MEPTAKAGKYGKLGNITKAEIEFEQTIHALPDTSIHKAVDQDRFEALSTTAYMRLVRRKLSRNGVGESYESRAA